MYASPMRSQSHGDPLAARECVHLFPGVGHEPQSFRLLDEVLRLPPPRDGGLSPGVGSGLAGVLRRVLTHHFRAFFFVRHLLTLPFRPRAPRLFPDQRTIVVGPIYRRMGQKVLQGHPAGADQKRSRPRKTVPERRAPATPAGPRTALHLDAHEIGTATEDEVDFVRAFAPMVQPRGKSGRVVEVRPCGALDDAPPEGAVGADLLEGARERRRHEGGVEDVELGARSAGAVAGAGVLGEADDQSRIRKEPEVVRQRGGVAGFLNLPEHLVVGEDPAGVVAGQLHQAAHERGFLDAGQRDDVPFDAGGEDGAAHGGTPHIDIADLIRHPRIATEEQVLIEAEAEGRRHFGIRPMAYTNGHEASGQAFVQTGHDGPRGGPGDDDAQWAPVAPIPVPLSLDDQRPHVHMLDFVEGQDEAPVALLGTLPCRFPRCRGATPFLPASRRRPTGRRGPYGPRPPRSTYRECPPGPAPGE